MVYIEMIKWELVYKILLSIFIWIPLTIGTSIYFTKLIKIKKTEIFSRRRPIVNLKNLYNIYLISNNLRLKLN